MMKTGHATSVPRMTSRSHRGLMGVLAAATMMSFAYAGQIWDGGGTNDNWSTTENWDDDTSPTFGSALTFQGNIRNTANNDMTDISGDGQNAGGITFANDGSSGKTNSFTLTGNKIYLRNNLTTTANIAGSTITDEISTDMPLARVSSHTFAINQLSPSVQHNLTISGDLSDDFGNNSITKQGGGVLTLGGNNTYSGLTTVGAGTLRLTGSLTASSVTVTGGRIDQSATGSIGGGDKTFSHSSPLISILDGNNTYEGATTISAGLVFVNGSTHTNSVVTVSGGAIGGTGTIGGPVSLTTAGGINLSDGEIGNLTIDSTLSLTGAANKNYLTFDLANAGATVDKIIATGAFTMNTAGAGVVSINQLGGTAGRLSAGTYDILTAASGITAGGSQFKLDTTKAFGQTFSLANTTTAALKLTTTQVTGATLANTTLSGTAPSWAVAGNFSGEALPDYMSNVIIDSALGTSPLNSSVNINSLTYGTSATVNTTISAGTATAGTPSSMLVIEAANANGNTAGNGITLNNTSGSHTISARVGLAANQTWTLAAGSTLTVSGVISDFGGGYGITKAGGGLLWLSGANTYTGTTTINGGVLRITSISAGVSPFSNITIDGGVLNIGSSDNFSRTLGSGVNEYQITGGVSGFSVAGGRTIVGAYPLKWGSTHFNPSTFILGGTDTSGTLAFQPAIDLNGDGVATTREIAVMANTTTISGLMQNLGSAPIGLTKSGAGTLILSNVNNAYDGNTTVSEGTLQVNAARFDDDADIIIASGAMLNLNFSGSDTIGRLSVGGEYQQPGEYSYTNMPTYFGNFAGSLTVTVGPPPPAGTVLILK